MSTIVGCILIYLRETAVIFFQNFCWNFTSTRWLSWSWFAWKQDWVRDGIKWLDKFLSPIDTHALLYFPCILVCKEEIYSTLPGSPSNIDETSVSKVAFDVMLIFCALLWCILAWANNGSCLKEQNNF